MGLAALAPLTSLTSLNFDSCYLITDAGVAALAPFTSLTSLDLGCCGLTDAQLAALVNSLTSFANCANGIHEAKFGTPKAKDDP